MDKENKDAQKNKQDKLKETKNLENNLELNS